MKRFTRVFVALTVYGSLYGLAGAAIPKNTEVLSMRKILALPSSQRFEHLQEKGPEGYRALVSLMFNRDETMDTRWKATMALARLGGKEAKPELTRALSDSVWYMRNAGLIAMQSIDRKEALAWAKRLLDDKALLVRVAAVDVIAEVGTQQDALVLWQRLYSQQNYKGGQSLFIRERIVSALARVEGPGKEAAFVKILSDEDENLHPAAIEALERSSRHSFGPVQGNLRQCRAQWLQWWKSRKI